MLWKLELNHKRKFGRSSNTWRLKSILLKNEWVKQEIKEEFKKYMEANENESTTVQKLWDAAKAVVKRGVHSNADLTQEARIISSKQHKLKPKGARKRTTNKT